MSLFTVVSVEDIQTVVQDNERLHIQGNGSKTALANPNNPILDMSQLSGIIDYQPQEYTFTAYAGTRIKDIQAELHDHEQYLPCDPLLVEKGATLGGTIASNLSGSRRFRYGGVRDFLLGATVVDGLGRVFRVGGKVVKNAAGFDLAKFLVGSLGHYMIMVDVTFKVFPEARDFVTHRFHYATLEDALSASYFINRQPFELDALDIELLENSWVLLARFAGMSETLSERVHRLIDVLHHNTALQYPDQVDDSVWSNINEFTWVGDNPNVVKVPIAPKKVPTLDASLVDMSRRYSVGGNIAWIATQDIENLSTILGEQQLTGLHVLGDSDNPILGEPIDNVFAQRVKAVLDPENKFV